MGWGSFIPKLNWLLNRGLASKTFAAGVPSIDKHLPAMVASLRSWRKAGADPSTLNQQEFFQRGVALEAEINALYNAEWRSKAFNRLQLTLGTNDTDEHGTFRLIDSPAVERMDRDLLTGKLPADVMKALPIMSLADSIAAIALGGVDCGLVNGSGNNRVAAARNAGQLSSLRKANPMRVLLHYCAVDAPFEWPPSWLLQIEEPVILQHAAIAAAMSVVGEGGDVRPMFAHSAGSLVPSMAARLIGSADAKSHFFVNYVNPALPPVLAAEMMAAKIEQPGNHFIAGAADPLGALATLGTAATQPLLAVPQPDVLVPAIGHSFGAGLSYYQDKVTDDSTPFKKQIADQQTRTNAGVIGLVHQGTKLASIMWGDPPGPGQLVDLDGDAHVVNDGGQRAAAAIAQKLQQIKLPSLDEIDEEEKKEVRDPKDPVDPDHPDGGDGGA